jgi:DNA-binding response OmpR family regulator
MSRTVLLVEDEESIREAEKLYLEQAGYVVIEAEDGEKAVTLWKERPADLVILDLNLPLQDGLEVCREIRRTSQVPILMVTARVEEIDELLGLEIGADDYLRKPFSPAILVARVNVLLRRSGKAEIITLGDLVIDSDKQEVRIGEKTVGLSTMPFRLLTVLAQHPGKIYSRSELLDTAYGEQAGDVYDRTIDAHIHAIRTAIEENPRQPHHLHTVIGRGYKLIA